METFSSNRRLNTKLRGNIAIKELEIIGKIYLNEKLDKEYKFEKMF